jgi:hypothetical protein
MIAIGAVLPQFDPFHTIRPMRTYKVYLHITAPCPFRIRTIRVRALKFVGDNVFGDFTDTDTENTELRKQPSVTTDSLVGFHTYSRDVFVELKKKNFKV